MKPRLTIGVVIVALFACSPQAHSAPYANVGACDLVVLGTDVKQLGAEPWASFSNGARDILQRSKERQETAEQTAASLIELQTAALAAVPVSDMAAYRASKDCRVVSEMKPGITSFAIDASRLDVRFRPFALELATLITAAETSLEETLSRIRVKAEPDLTRIRIGHYCFIASLVAVASSATPATRNLEATGKTISCTAAQRID